MRIVPGGFHKPAFYLSTFFTAPIGLHLWRKEITAWYKRIPARLAGYALMALAIKVFFSGPWIFVFLLLLGRPLRWIAMKLGFDESREPPRMPQDLFFPLTRIDKAAMIFIAIILVVFFVNRDQLMPKEDSDHNYHMAVTRQILERGEIPSWDDWEYAPAGRPHLYPPALHLAIAAFAGRVERVTAGFQTLQVLAYPLALFLTWWFIRWMFGARLGFLGALVFSMDMLSGFLMIAVLPSAVVTGLMPLLFMCFLTKRTRACIVLLTLSFYTHIGVPIMIVLGLFLFSVRHRGYYPFFKKVLMWSLIFYLPWFLRVLPDLGWMGSPSLQIAQQGGKTLASYMGGAVLGFLMLQMINPILIVLYFLGLRRFKEPGAVFLGYMLVGFLPMLITYGGRFWMHTGPIWAVFAASILLRLIPELPRPRRLVVLILCTMIPMPMIAIGMPNNPRPRIIPSVGGAAFTLAYVLTPATEDADFEALAEFIGQNTSEKEIVHVAPEKQYLGDRIVHETGRRVDVGGWSAEVRSEAMVKTVEDYRRGDTNCLFIYEKAEVPAALKCDRVEKIGRFNVGIRGKIAPLPQQTHPPEKRG